MSDARAAYKLTEILIQDGHRRIAGIFKYDDMQGIERYKGFVECLSDYGVKFDATINQLVLHEGYGGETQQKGTSPDVSPHERLHGDDCIQR